jgi:hypothetical protein
MASNRNRKIRKNPGLAGFSMDLGANNRGDDLGISTPCLQQAGS